MTTSANGSNGPLRVVAICGSLRPGSFTRKALAVALEGTREQGAETHLLDLADYDLPQSRLERLRKSPVDDHSQS